MDDQAQVTDFVLGDEFAKVLTETTQSLVCVLDRDGRILFFNDACELATGFTREDVLGGDARDFVIPLASMSPRASRRRCTTSSPRP